MSEDQASALFRRAAQLQAEDVKRREAVVLSSVAVTSAHVVGGVQTQGYELRHIREAAKEVGISEQYLKLAMAELPTDTASRRALAPTGRREERRATFYLGTAQRSCSVSKTMPASPRRVLQAIGQALQQSPYELMLKDTVGGHPLDGGVLVFQLPGSTSLTQASMGHIKQAWYNTRHSLEAETVQVTLRAIPGNPNACEVTMFADLRPGVRRNMYASQIFGTIFGSFGGLIGGGIGAKTMATLPAVFGVGGAIAASVVGLTLVGYRAIYRNCVRKAEGEMRTALDAVGASLRSQDLFGSLPPLRRPAGDATGDDGSAMVLLS